MNPEELLNLDDVDAKEVRLYDELPDPDKTPDGVVAVQEATLLAYVEQDGMWTKWMDGSRFFREVNRL